MNTKKKASAHENRVKKMKREEEAKKLSGSLQRMLQPQSQSSIAIAPSPSPVASVSAAAVDNLNFTDQIPMSLPLPSEQVDAVCVHEEEVVEALDSNFKDVENNVDINMIENEQK